MAHFYYYGDFVDKFSSRVWLGVSAGVVSVLLGLLAASISRQFPWMITGWRFGFLLNGPVSAVIAAIPAALICSVVMGVMTSDANHYPSDEAMQTAYTMMLFFVVASAFWGFVFGSWFAMRRDKYFVQPV